MTTQVASGIYTIPQFFSPEQCLLHIRNSESLGYDAATITTGQRVVLDQNVRNNTRVIIDDQQLATTLWLKLQAHITPFMDGCQAIGLNERFRYYRYDPSQKFAGHVDSPFLRANGEKSKLTFMVYLNDEFAGGETAFSESIISPVQGMALLFRHELFHEGCAVTSGRKYVLRSDVMFNPPGRISG